ncbi:DNA ligase [Rhodococcus opacus]|nr:DNA ligase [Rhodococcus opacus]
MRLIAPMLATPGEPPEQMDGAWAAEMKYDGCRLLVAVGGDEPPVLWTRNLNVVTSSYPGVAEALTEAFGGRGRIVLDGEVVALTQGRPSFARLQKRMNTLRPSTTVRRQVPVTYLPFDVLRLDGGNLIQAPYLERRAALTDLGHELHGAGLPLQVLPHWVGVDSAVILDAAQNASMEGAIFKKVSSTYQPGKRARSWRKVLLRTRSSALVIGWIPGGGVQRNMVGSLVLGAYDDQGVIRYVGNVGTGFSMAVRRQLKEKLATLERRTSPLGTDAAAAEEHGIVRWVEPVIVVDVAYHGSSNSGGLRHPSFKGQRGDLDPGSITRDSL